MEKIPGQRGSTIFAFNGYTYYLDKESGYIYRCTHRTRAGRCHTAAHYNECGEIEIRGVHFDVSHPDVVGMSIMKEKMKEVCRKNHSDPLLKIFNGVCME